jgi:hypothetical protein
MEGFLMYYDDDDININEESDSLNEIEDEYDCNDEKNLICILCFVVIAAMILLCTFM